MMAKQKERMIQNQVQMFKSSSPIMQVSNNQSILVGYHNKNNIMTIRILSEWAPRRPGLCGDLLVSLVSPVQLHLWPRTQTQVQECDLGSQRPGQILSGETAEIQEMSSSIVSCQSLWPGPMVRVGTMHCHLWHVRDSGLDVIASTSMNFKTNISVETKRLERVWEVK